MSLIMMKYVIDRDKAMMAYPDTSKLEALYNKYNALYPPELIRKWKNSSDLFKTMILESMILSWREAPAELVAKVNEARERRKSS